MFPGLKSGDSPLYARPFRIGLLAVILLVVLRITIGWHFLYQGMWKLSDPQFSSAGFLGNSKGPLAEHYYALIPDFWGREHLDRAKALERIHEDRRRFAAQFKLDDAQTRLADQITQMHRDKIEDFFKENKESLETYFHDLDRLEKAKQSSASELEFQKKRNWDKQQELQRKAKAWMTQLDGWLEQYRQQLAGLISDRAPATDSVFNDHHLTMDRFITYSNIAVGLCLMVGLFTRVASLGGAMFLLTIILAQPEWPGIYPPAPAAAGRSLLVTKEVVEMMAMLALAALPVGRWAGLDFFIHYLVVRPLFGKR